MTDNRIPDHGAASPADRFDAGHSGCGELVVDLRARLTAMVPGSVLHLIAHDPGVPEDLPAWCRLTGHRLLSSQPPNFFIQRKPS